MVFSRRRRRSPRNQNRRMPDSIHIASKYLEVGKYERLVLKRKCRIRTCGTIVPHAKYLLTEAAIHMLNRSNNSTDFVAENRGR